MMRCGLTAIMLLALTMPAYSQVNAVAPVSRLALTSQAFDDNTIIPMMYTCKGTDISPTLLWQGVPEATKNFALIMDDPDTAKGLFTHWLVYNIPANDTRLTAQIRPAKSTDVVQQGLNDAGVAAYTGPCPPADSGLHHYHFTLYALNTELQLPMGVSKPDLQRAMDGHIIGQAVLTGLQEN